MCLTWPAGAPGTPRGQSDWATPAPTVYEGLTEEQWKLVNLMEAVQSLEEQVAALHGVNRPDGSTNSANDNAHVVSMPPADGPSNNLKALPDLALPVSKLRQRISELAQRMLELEEQLERAQSQQQGGDASTQPSASTLSTPPSQQQQLQSGSTFSHVSDEAHSGAQPKECMSDGGNVGSSSSSSCVHVAMPAPPEIMQVRRSSSSGVAHHPHQHHPHPTGAVQPSPSHPHITAQGAPQAAGLMSQQPLALPSELLRSSQQTPQQAQGDVRLEDAHANSLRAPKAGHEVSDPLATLAPPPSICAFIPCDCGTRCVRCGLEGQPQNAASRDVYQGR